MNTKWVLCLNTDGDDISLVRMKVYRRLEDKNAEKRNLIRVVDETGEDYLYPETLFLPLEMSPPSEMRLEELTAA